jgi:hypothetical protein
MASAYLVDTSRSLVLSKAFGTLTDDDLLGHVRALRADATFHNRMFQIADFRDVVKIAISSVGVRKLGALNPFGEGARRAVVVTTDFAYGMARMYEMIREPSDDELEIFRTLEKAVEWLGLGDELETISARLDTLR